MSENAIDRENIGKPAPDRAKPKADRTNKKEEVIVMMKREWRDVDRNHGGNEVAGAYHPSLRQHPGQQGRGDDRVVQERRGRTDIQDREISSGNSSSKRRLGRKPGRRSCFQARLSDVMDRSRHWQGGFPPNQ